MFSCLQIPQNFACGGPKSHILTVLVCSDPRNFRLRRPKKRQIPYLMCFLGCRSTPLSFAKFSLRQICANRYRNALLPFAKQNRSRAGAIPVCFAGIGTRHCHSRNKIGAAHCPGTMPAFYGCKNVPLPVAERFYKPPKRRARRRRKFLGFYPSGYGPKLYFILVLRCFLSPFLKVFGHSGSLKSSKFRLRRA